MGWYYSITEEMRQWGLSGNELLVYALVNTYSQGSQGCYWGSLEHTCDCCGISRATAIRTFKSLISRGFITRNKVLLGEKLLSAYIATKVSKCDLQNQNDTTEGIKMTPNIKEDININTLSYKGRSHFQKPSIDEIRDYCSSRRNQVDPEQFFNFYESKGWMVGKSPMKDWKASVRTWEKREKEVAPRKREKKSESVFEHNLKVMDQLYGTNLHEKAYGGGQFDEQ